MDTPKNTQIFSRKQKPISPKQALLAEIMGIWAGSCMA